MSEAATPVTTRAILNSIQSEMCGATVLRPFRLDGEFIRAGTVLDAEQVKGLRNVESLRRQGRIHIHTRPPGGEVVHESVAPEGSRRFAIHRGCGKYDVIEGVMLNTEKLTKDEAEALVANQPAH